MKKGSAFRGIGQDKAYSSHCLIILAFSYLHKSDSHRKPLILEFLPVSTLRCQQPGNTLKQPFYLPPMSHLTPNLDDQATDQVRSCLHVVVVNHVISGHVLALSITWSVATRFFGKQTNHVTGTFCPSNVDAIYLLASTSKYGRLWLWMISKILSIQEITRMRRVDYSLIQECSSRWLFSILKPYL